jgi:hypothetical protein
MAKDAMKFSYDADEDILYGYVGDKPSSALYHPFGNGVYLRIDPITSDPIGFMIIDFERRRNLSTLPSIPHFGDVSIPPLSEIAH